MEDKSKTNFLVDKTQTDFAYYHTLNCRGRLLSLETPKVMGILNLTPDSFSDGGLYNAQDKALHRVGEMLQEGAEIIDIGGYSSRPYAPEVSEQEELDRIAGITTAILDQFPEAIVSIDTFRANVAEEMLALGAHIINDISGGLADKRMWEVVAKYKAPYILMHMQGNPGNMQDSPAYQAVIEEVWDYFVFQVKAAREAGLGDIVIDPGFGFGKSMKHNYQLWQGIARFHQLGLPILGGLSRKSMIYKLLKTTPDDVLEITTALHYKLLENGVQLLRVHDVKAARKVIEVYTYLRSNGII